MKVAAWVVLWCGWVLLVEPKLYLGSSLFVGLVAAVLAGLRAWAAHRARY